MCRGTGLSFGQCRSHQAGGALFELQMLQARHGATTSKEMQKVEDVYAIVGCINLEADAWRCVDIQHSSEQLNPLSSCDPFPARY